MPFFIRKSVSVGPFRFNLSKSGIGLSAGITGARIGVGPRGQYVHAGRGGIYYRKTLSSKPEGLLFNGGRPIDAPSPTIPVVQPANLESIDSGSVLEMTDASSSDLLQELNEKQRLAIYWPFALIFTILICIGLILYGAVLWITVVIAAVGLALTVHMRGRDVMRKTVPILYDLESEAEEKYRLLHESLEELKNVNRVWIIEAQRQTENEKYDAGATQLIRRQRIDVGVRLPTYISCNIEPPAIPVGRQTLFFFPDKLLIQEGKNFGAVNYRDLKLDVRETRFVEQDEVPGDAKVVGRTWKYVNKSGEPDRRFKDNQEIPLVLYEEIRLTSNTGLNEVLQISRQGVGERIKNALSDLIGWMETSSPTPADGSKR